MNLVIKACLVQSTTTSAPRIKAETYKKLYIVLYLPGGERGNSYVGRGPSLIKHIQNTKPTNNGAREGEGGKRAIYVYVGRDHSLINHIQNTKPTNNGARERERERDRQTEML